MSEQEELLKLLARIAGALERQAPVVQPPAEFTAAGAFVWQAATERFLPVPEVNRMPLQLLRGIERPADQLLENTRRFANGLPANNALLWGARGMGKSSLVKAIHAEVNGAAGKSRAKNAGADVKLVEIHREDIDTLPRCLALMRAAAGHRFIVFCDDLSFDRDDTSYKSLKALLEGGIEGRPENVVFYATSNRRHLMPRDMMENERSTAINPSEATQEKLSLSDRFGLWLGFYNCSQDQYLEMVRGYARYYRLSIDDGVLTADALERDAPGRDALERDALERDALEWSASRGARSGRVAWQYIQDLAGRLGKKLVSR